ncbi:unnamed protein product [Cylicocyclus nassatus]|uniref:Methyltransferase-like protein 13 n=1 Tax=Cylicocyclus nassatus TaxID=53992 RepID=A0AA36GSZ4_CYLNA|nr:unnamed protein product [Cylicocyclus nassatus]
MGYKQYSLINIELRRLVKFVTDDVTILTLETEICALGILKCFVASSTDDHNSYGLNGDGEEVSKQGYSKAKDRRQQRIEETQKLVMKRLLSKPRRKIDELCSELDRTCFTITDKMFKHGNALFAFRSLRRKGPEGVLILSQTKLQPQLPLNWENFNSKAWIVKKDYVRLTYAQLMIAGAFLSGGLEFNTTRKQDVLIIGLGGGVINNYFTQMKNQVLNVTVVDIDPVMLKVAKKWFGFTESPLHRIVIDDGVRYIHDAARRGEKYDVLIIDVCYNIPLPMMCPTKEFLEDDLIASMKAITTDNGAVIVNLIVKQSEEALKALPLYSRHYPSCYFINYGKEKPKRTTLTLTLQMNAFAITPKLWISLLDFSCFQLLIHRSIEVAVKNNDSSANR